MNLQAVPPYVGSFEARLLIENMKDIPDDIRDRLEMAIGGPILNPDDWKQKFSEYFPRIIAIWLKEKSSEEIDTWILPVAALKKLEKGKHALNKKLTAKLKPIADQPFSSQEDASTAFKEAFGKKANMAKRVITLLEHQRQTQQSLNQDAWLQISNSLGVGKSMSEQVSDCVQDEDALAKILTPACHSMQITLFQQVEQQIKLLQSDAWVDAEIQNREEHMQIKIMLLEGKIAEHQ